MVAEVKSIRLEKKLVIVGDGNCGKTCLLISYIDGKMPAEYVPTVFETYVTDIKLGNIECELALYDTAGQDAYDRLRPLSYPDTDVFLVVFSVDSPDSLYNAFDKWMPEVRHFCPSSPVILVCTKVDLRDDADTISKLQKLRQYPVTEQEGREMAEKVFAHAYIECSSLTQYNVNEVFELAVTSTLQKRKSSKQKKGGLFMCKII